MMITKQVARALSRKQEYPRFLPFPEDREGES